VPEVVKSRASESGRNSPNPRTGEKPFQLGADYITVGGLCQEAAKPTAAALREPDWIHDALGKLDNTGAKKFPNGVVIFHGGSQRLVASAKSLIPLIMGASLTCCFDCCFTG
jgi:hypothetical protein